MSKGRSHNPMKRPLCCILAAIMLLGTWAAIAQTQSGLNSTPFIVANANQATTPGTDHAEPALAVSQRILDFGSVPVGRMKTLSLTVKNVGGGLLTGAASVSGPFNILGDSPYAVKYPQTQVIHVQYVPTSVGLHMAVIHLSGGGGATVTLMGSGVPRRTRAPAPPQNLRLLASR